MTQISTDFLLLWYKKQHNTTTSNFHKERWSVFWSGIWWAQVCSSLLLLCNLTSTSATATARGRVTQFCGFLILKVSSNFPPSKGEDWKLVKSRHSASFYIQPSYTPVLSCGGCFGLPPPKGNCHQFVLWKAGDPLRVYLGWGGSGLLSRANFKCEY